MDARIHVTNVVLGKPSEKVEGKRIRGTRRKRPLLREWLWARIKLCVALLLKMASGSEVPEYSSPAKRRKVDGIGYNSTSCVKPDLQDCRTPHDNPNEELEGILIKIWSIR